MHHGITTLQPPLYSTSTHNRQLPARTGHLTDGNFITRLLYKDCYWTFITMSLFTLYSHFTRLIPIVTAVRFVIVDFKEMNEWMNAPSLAWLKNYSRPKLPTSLYVAYCSLHIYCTLAVSTWPNWLRNWRRQSHRRIQRVKGRGGRFNPCDLAPIFQQGPRRKADRDQGQSHR